MTDIKYELSGLVDGLAARANVLQEAADSHLQEKNVEMAMMYFARTNELLKVCALLEHFIGSIKDEQ